MALALFVGVVAQGVARHLSIPGIVVLLASGVALGPDGLGAIHPETLGHALESLVGFAVAVILFEGGLALDVRRLLRRATVLRRLTTLGAAITAVGGTAAAMMFLGWDLRMSLLFGTLVIVTGPTVVTPLLRRWRVRARVSTILEAEGVLIDPIGAIIAAVALEVALQPSGLGVLVGLGDIVLRLGFGGLIGVGFGFALHYALRHQRIVPTGLENLLALGAVMVLYQISNAVVHESGIAAVTLAGIATGHEDAPVLEELHGFKEQLTTLFIGMLFVLLAADVRLADVTSLGMGAVWVVVLLMLVVRPLNVLVGTWGSDLSYKERLFMAWIGPRGIVAAAVASLFATELAGAGLEGGTELRAMTFLVIAVTVAVSGLTGGPLASALGLRGDPERGWLVLGAGSLARLLARCLDRAGEDVVVIDSNPRAIRRAEEDGLRVVRGNGLDERVLHRAGLDYRRNLLAVTRNPEVNALFIETAREHATIAAAAAARVDPTHEGEETARLFGTAVDVDRWSSLLEAGAAFVERWRLEEGRDPDKAPLTPGECDANALLPVARLRNGRATPVIDGTRFLPGDEVIFVLAAERAARAREVLEAHGWVLVFEEDLPTEEVTSDREPARRA